LFNPQDVEITISQSTRYWNGNKTKAQEKDPKTQAQVVVSDAEGVNTGPEPDAE